MKGNSSVDWTIIGDGKELDIHGAHLAPYTFPTSIDYLERGLIDIEPIITDHLPLEDYAKGFAAVEHPESSIKVMLCPS
jgi:threonine dehydrogenase-like Zn-dependent dehydrogenase